MEITGQYRNLLNIFIYDPKDVTNNFNLGMYYESHGQTASAVSFFLRAAEFSPDKLVSYESLLHIAFCLEKQGCRVFTTKGILLRAISLLPDRPEAYYFLSRLYERNKDWQEAYTVAELCLNFTNFSVDPLVSVKEYHGKYCLIFEKAVAAWWIGLFDESVHLFRKLNNEYILDDIHKRAVQNNLNSFGNSGHPPTPYDSSMHNKLRIKFKNSEKLQYNHSQCFQDMFTLMMLNGKENGTYLEIGSGDPFYGNNTALLETKYNWKGISIDFNKQSIDMFNKVRKNVSYCLDATKANYKSLLSEITDDRFIDYLQIDCDPATTSYNILQKIPFNEYKFAVITFEHDAYINNDNVKQSSRKLLTSYGYKMVAGDVAPDRYSNFEDWWMHPDLIDSRTLELMTCSFDGTKKAEDYILGKV